MELFKYDGTKSVTLKNKEVTIKLTAGDAFTIEYGDKCIVKIVDYCFNISRENVDRLISMSIKEEVETFEQKLKRVVGIASEKLSNIFRETYPKTSNTTSLSYELGSKFARIVQKNGSSRSAWCFVDRNELLWKPAGWKAPARNFARGKLDDLLNEKFLKQHMYGF